MRYKLVKLRHTLQQLVWSVCLAPPAVHKGSATVQRTAIQVLFSPDGKCRQDTHCMIEGSDHRPGFFLQAGFISVTHSSSVGCVFHLEAATHPAKVSQSATQLVSQSGSQQHQRATYYGVCVQHTWHITVGWILRSKNSSEIWRISPAKTAIRVGQDYRDSGKQIPHNLLARKRMR